MPHPEPHRTHRIGWLRAAVLGANDGIVSTASLLLGVAAATESRSQILIAGAAGLVAGAMSMAAGEFVSVSSQADVERADLARERFELDNEHELEVVELATLYQGRGLAPNLAEAVARQLMAHDALGVHAREELGISETLTARPTQAAFASAATFAVGAALPLATAAIAPRPALALLVSVASLLSLAMLGALSARTGGAPVVRAAFRVTFWGALAMALTYGVGAMVGAAV